MKQQNSFWALLALFMCFSIKTKAQDHTNAFITVWDTQYLTSDFLVIPSEGTNYQYYWEKVGSESAVNADTYQNNNNTLSIPTITAGTGTYKVYIKGNYTHIGMFENANAAKALIAVQSWGNIHWLSMLGAFRGCSNLVSLPAEAPDLTAVADMEMMFMGASKFNQPIGHWDVSNVIYMGLMFNGATSFNQPIGSWNVSNLQSTGLMFYGATSFNQPIGNWDVSNVTYMGLMFNTATAFNQPIGNWNVGNVYSMSLMFNGAKAFNQDISNWNVSNVKDMGAMFNASIAFNQNISNWNVSNVTNMNSMFCNAMAFNQPIGNWNVAKATNMGYMFYGTKAFNQDISNWSVAGVKDMSFMFNEARAFNQNIGKWELNPSVLLQGMLDYSGLSSLNYGLTLKGLAENDNIPNYLNLDAVGIKYASTYQTYRDKLTTAKFWGGKGWGIIDGGTDHTLPITLVSFSAKADGNYAKLQWKTANEQNNKGFEIWRKTEDKGLDEFVKIGEVPASNIYHFTDKNPLNGNNYYKLVQIDNDGKATELGVRTVALNLAPYILRLYPSPAREYIDIGVGQIDKIFTVYNVQGKILMQQQFSQTQNRIDISSLSAGVYFYNYGNQKGKFVKVQ